MRRRERQDHSALWLLKAAEGSSLVECIGDGRFPSGRDSLSDWFSTTPASSQARGAMMSTLACGQEGCKWLLNNVPSHDYPRKAVYWTLQWLLTSLIVTGPSIGLCMQRIRHGDAPVVHGLGTELPAAHTASTRAPATLLQTALRH
jgi:hypothetical protein